MDSSKSRKQGAAISVINMIVSLLIGVLYTPFLLRFLGQEEYGVYTLAQSVISYLAILDLGFGNALVRYSARKRAEGLDDKNLNGMFLIFYLAIAAIALIVGLIMMLNIEDFFGTSFSSSETKILKIVFLILLINTVIAFPSSVFSSIIRAYERFAWANGLTLIKNILIHVVNLTVMFMGFKSIGIALVSLVFTIILTILNIYYSVKILHVKFGFEKFEKSFYLEVFRYSFFILINIIVDRLYASTDNIILGKLCGSTAVAVYGIGVVFELYFTQFSTSISGVYLPYISQLSTEKDGIESMSNIFLRIGHIQYTLLAFIFLGFIVFGKNFISVWAGPGYEMSYYIALLIMLPNIIPLSQNIGISILQALNKHSVRSIMYLLIALLNVGLSIPLAMKFGEIGVAIGTVIGMLLGQIAFMNWFYWKKIGINIPLYWKNVCSITIKYIPLFCIFLLINKSINLDSWIGICLKVLMAVACAIPYIYFIQMNSEEKQLVLDIRKKISKR